LQNYFKVKSASFSNGVNRILDANINRAKEGLRVCEEITRFILNSPNSTEDFKKIRHEIDSIVKNFSSLELLKVRSSFNDVGRAIYVNELKRNNLQDIFFANIQRVKESIRVLEEFTKLKNSSGAVKFKRLRYRIYDIEKKVAKRISALRNH
jgi:thiamine-phosphate pyrophosphorylase